MSKHNFIESSDQFGEYARLIYCTWCGRVVWHFNKNEKSDTKPSDLQGHVGEPCIDSELKNIESPEQLTTPTQG